MSPEARIVSGLIIITIPTIQFGGVFLLYQLGKRVAGYIDNPLRRGFYTAGHAHAGVLVMLSLIVQPLVDQTTLPDALHWFTRLGPPSSAILISAGFFLSVPFSGDVTKPNGLIRLIYVGALVLASALIIVGIGLITAS